MSLIEFLPTLEIIQKSDPYIVIKAIRECYQSESDNFGEKDIKLIKRIIDSGHLSTIEHAIISFRFEGYTRLMLQELARHRIASYSIKSTRYTLKELKNETFFQYGRDSIVGQLLYKNVLKYVLPPLKFFESYYEDELLDFCDFQGRNLEKIQKMLNKYSNDIVKYYLPECYRTSGIVTMNLRSLRNFLSLRMDKSAHFEIRHLANTLFFELSQDKYYKLFIDDLNYETNN